jgi:hypothetical protein
MLKRSEGLADLKKTTYRKYKESTHMSDRSSNQSSQLEQLSNLAPITAACQGISVHPKSSGNKHFVSLPIARVPSKFLNGFYEK